MGLSPKGTPYAIGVGENRPLSTHNLL